jgi:hypothetical protein
MHGSRFVGAARYPFRKIHETKKIRSTTFILVVSQSEVVGAARYPFPRFIGVAQMKKLSTSKLYNFLDLQLLFW